MLTLVTTDMFDDAHQCADLNRRLTTTREHIRKIWDGPTALPHFTRHGYDHSQRIEEYLGALLSLLAKPLTLAEQYILVSAVWIHDVGMQDARFSLGDKPVSSFVDHEHDYLAIRDAHAAASQAWIMEVYDDTRRHELNLGVERDDFARAIATLVRAHTDYDLNHVPSTDYVMGKDARLRLLATLLVIADELDLDHRRVDMSALSRLNIPDESKVHWWCHHYVSGVSIAGRTPYIHMILPSSCEGLLADQWKQLAAAGVRKHLLKPVVQETLAQEGCWLDLPRVSARFDDAAGKQEWPRGVPLDTRAAIQQADLQLLQRYRPSDVLSYFGVDLYGVPVNELSPDELDRVGEAMINLIDVWGKLTRAHFDYLVRQLRDRVHAVLADAPLGFFTKHYLYVRAHTILVGRFEEQATPQWDRPRRFPTDPSEEYLWEKMRSEYASPWLATEAVYYQARGAAASECAKHPAVLQQIERIIDDVSKHIVIATVLSNAFLTRLDDNGAYQALAPFVAQFNRDAGPLTTAASKRMVEQHRAASQDGPSVPAVLPATEGD